MSWYGICRVEARSWLQDVEREGDVDTGKLMLVPVVGSARVGASTAHSKLKRLFITTVINFWFPHVQQCLTDAGPVFLNLPLAFGDPIWSEFTKAANTIAILAATTFTLILWPEIAL